MLEVPHEIATSCPPLKWSKVKEDAALLVAVDELTDDAIVANLGIGKRTLGDWKAHPDFKARVDSHISEFRARVRRRGIAIVENRVAHLQRRHDKLNQVIIERGQSLEMQEIPGGKTGLLVHNVKSVGYGENSERVDLYEVDTGLLQELRQHEKQAAQELGQWAEKHDVSGEIKAKVSVEVTHKFDYDAYQSDFARFAGERLRKERDTALAGNGN